MWFQLNTTFSTHLGALSTLQSNYGVTYSLSNFTKTTAPDMVEKDKSLTVVLTMAEGATFSTASMTDGTNTVTGSLDGSTVTMTISEVKGPVTVIARATVAGDTTNPDDGGTEGDDSGTVTYTITYKYQSGGIDIKTATTETVAAGTSKTFSTSNAPTIDGYTVSSVSPTSATINANTTVIYSYTAVASGSYGPNLLSNGELNEGYTLGSASCTMTEKAEAYTYMYVPIEAGATYYGLNFKRCWWLDADKNALETYNGKNNSPQWTATAPSNAAYWCGCAYYTEQELATASFAKVLS